MVIHVNCIAGVNREGSGKAEKLKKREEEEEATNCEEKIEDSQYLKFASANNTSPANWSDRQYSRPVVQSPAAGISKILFQRQNNENRLIPVQFIVLSKNKHFDK